MSCRGGGISHDKRKSVWNRDRGYCQNCGIECVKKVSSSAQGTISRVVPKSQGGSRELGNLQLLCLECSLCLRK